MLDRAPSYDALQRAFRWQVPARYNIGVDICDRHVAVRGDRPAIIHEDQAGHVSTLTFARLKELSDRLANALTGLGLRRGDRLGILLPQGFEAAITHIAAYKAGLVAIPLFVLFGADALEYRLGNAGARAVVTDAANLPKLLEIRERLPDVRSILVSGGGSEPGTVEFWRTLEAGSASFTPVDTAAEEPALLIYTSGTTGPPKGALHAHRVLLGHLPGVELPHEFFPQPGDFYWTPADWAWIGGLIDVLLPSLHHGVPVLAHRVRRFDPEQAFDLMARHGVRNAFIPPTGLKLMRQVDRPRERFATRLRSLASGGETLGAELLDWGRGALGLVINEFYGQTEANVIVANCDAIMETRPGSTGRPVPGHRLAIVDDAGRELPRGSLGQIAVARPDPVMFLEYWKNPDATAAKFAGDWALTGDLGRMDDDGYLWYVGRSDDVITSSGYRIGPAEVEDCILKHPAVAMAAVVGSPDPVRTEIVKAFVVAKPGVPTSADLAAAISRFVRERLAAHEYPREVEFVSELPLTATGKIIRRELRAREIARKSSLAQS